MHLFQQLLLAFDLKSHRVYQYHLRVGERTHHMLTHTEENEADRNFAKHLLNTLL